MSCEETITNESGDNNEEQIAVVQTPNKLAICCETNEVGCHFSRQLDELPLQDIDHEWKKELERLFHVKEKCLAKKKLIENLFNKFNIIEGLNIFVI